MESSSSSSWKRNLQIVIAIMMVIAGIRVYLIYRERNEPAPTKAEPVGYSDPDFYVFPRKLHAYDLKSLRTSIMGKTIWVKAGNQLIYYPYNAAGHHIDFKQDKQLLPPIAALHVEDVISASGPPSPVSMHAMPNQQEIMILFKLDGDDRQYAVSAGTTEGENSIYFDDVFFIEDPHVLYKHWSADVWNAVNHHEVKPGMNELQTSFALGSNVTVVSGGDNMGNRTLEFANAGKPIDVTFSHDKATSIEPVTK